MVALATILLVEDEPRIVQLGAILEEQGIPADGQRLAYMVMHSELHLAVCSGPMAGKQHTYAPFDDRVTGEGPSGDEALAVLALRYFTTRGPATSGDFAWWAGLKAADAKLGLQLAADSIELRTVDGVTYALVDDGAPAVTERAHLVQCYDEAIIAYRQTRGILRSDSISFDTPGRVDGFTHVILLDGQLLGHWRLTPNGLDTRLAARVDAPAAASVDTALDRTRRFFAPRAISSQTPPRPRVR